MLKAQPRERRTLWADLSCRYGIQVHSAANGYILKFRDVETQERLTLVFNVCNLFWLTNTLDKLLSSQGFELNSSDQHVEFVSESRTEPRTPAPAVQTGTTSETGAVNETLNASEDDNVPF